MKTKRVCDDLIIEDKSGSGGVWKPIIAVILVGLIIWFVGWGRKMIPAFNPQYISSEEESSDDYVEDTTHSVAVNSLDYARNQLSGASIELYDTILGSLENKEFTIVNGIDEYTSDEIFDVAYLVFMDHPELCWYDGSCTITTDQITGKATKVMFDEGYGLLCPQSKIDSVQSTAEDAAAAIIAKAETLSGDYEKAVYVHDELVNRIKYSNELAARRGTDEPDDVSLQCSMYGALVNNSTVCQGYVQSFQYIMKELGIECAYVGGTANGADHGWNLIKLEGDYYYVDVTWDDPVPTESNDDILSHEYCFVTSAQIGKDHEADTRVYLPTATATKCNYYMRSGLYLETYSYEGAKECIKTALDANVPVEILFGSSDEFKKGLSALIEGGDYNSIMAELGQTADSYFYTEDDPLIRFS